MKTHIVVGLGYGDEGKGSWVDHLVRRHCTRYVVRFNGGAQALHHVVSSQGKVHGFSQFGSATLIPGTFTVLSRFMLVDPQYAFEEASRIETLGITSPLSQLIVSENAPVITPYNRLMNRMLEVSRGGRRHGSCGFGIGVTQGDVETLGAQALYVRDLSTELLRKKLFWLQSRRLEEAERFRGGDTADLYESLCSVDIEWYVNLYREFARRVRVASDTEIATILRENDSVFEGAQGVLLDQSHGFFPYCTRSTTTFENAETLLREAQFDGTISRIGLLRGYGTRHGAGPFVTEDSSLALPPCHNQQNPWQGAFRLGWFDAVAARYALSVTKGVDILAITNLDRLSGLSKVKVGTEYRMQTRRFVDESGALRVFPGLDRHLLTERSEELARASAKYLEIRGWGKGDHDGQERYLDSLAQAIDHPIHAFSDTEGPAKIYRVLSPVP